MRRLETERLGGFNETQIDPPIEFDVTLPNGRKLGYAALIENIPAITSSRDDHYDPQLVIATASDTPEWDDTAHYPVQRLSNKHGRNVEVVSQATTITDQYGNEFHNIGIKGSDFTDPRLIPWQPADRGYIVHGLQESIVMERVLRASRLLREHGVDTEYTIGLALPEKYLMPQSEGIDDVVALENKPFVEQAVARYLRTFSDEERKDLDLFAKKAELIDKVHDIEYIISLRAMKTPYRLQEIWSSQTNFTGMLKQLAEQAENPQLNDYAAREDSYWFYAVFELPGRIASSVAKMHNLGLVHGFLHTGNITALGGIVDLDSVRGPALELGDDEVTVRDQAKDVETVLYALGMMLAPKQFTNDPENRSRALNFLEHGFEEFIKDYCDTRGFTDEQKIEFIAEISALNSKRAHEDCIDHRIFQGYVLKVLLPGILSEPSFENIEDESLSDISKSDSDYFSRLPAKLFNTMRGLVMSNFVPFTYKIGTTQPLLTGAVKDVYCRRLGQSYLEGKISASQYLWHVASVDAWDVEQLPELVRNKIIPFNAIRMGQLYDKLSKPKLEDVQSPTLANILKTSLPELLERHAVLQFEKLTVDVIYIQEKEERDALVEKFLDSCKSLNFVDIEDLDENNFAEMMLDPGHVVLIGPLSLANDFARAHNYDIIADIITHYEWPFSMIRGVDSGDITLYGKRGSDEDWQLFSHEVDDQ